MGLDESDQTPLHLTPLQILRKGNPSDPESVPGRMGIGEGSIKFYSKFEEDIIIPTSIIHPRSWDSSKNGRNPQTTLYIGEFAIEALRRRKGPKKRQPQPARIWVPKHVALEEGREKGYWKNRRRNPKNRKGGKPFDSSGFESKEVEGGKHRDPGRKPHGIAYIVRREAWHVLASERRLWHLITNQKICDLDVGNKKKISLRLPVLEEEISELIIEEMLFHKSGGFHDNIKARKVLFDWLSYPKMDFEKTVVEEVLGTKTKSPIINHLHPLIQDLVKKHWKKLLSRWIELNAIYRHLLDSKEIDSIKSSTTKKIQIEEEKSVAEQELTVYDELSFDFTQRWGEFIEEDFS